MNNVQRNQQATGEADRQAKYVEKGEKLIVPDIAPGNFEIILQHGISIANYEKPRNPCRISKD